MHKAGSILLALHLACVRVCGVSSASLGASATRQAGGNAAQGIPEWMVFWKS